MPADHTLPTPAIEDEAFTNHHFHKQFFRVIPQFLKLGQFHVVNWSRNSLHQGVEPFNFSGSGSVFGFNSGFKFRFSFG